MNRSPGQVSTASLVLWTVTTCVLASSSFAWAQTGAISGRVLDRDGLAVPYATVLIKGTVLGGATNAKGGFLISGVPVGTYAVMVRSIPNGTSERTGVQVRAGQTTVIELRYTIPKTRPPTDSEIMVDPKPGAERPQPPHPQVWVPPCPAPRINISSWVRVDCQGFSFLLPRDFRKVEVQGKDSYVGSYEAPDSTGRISFGFGAFSDPLDRFDGFSRYGSCFEVIGGKEARVISAVRMDGDFPQVFRYYLGAAWRDVTPSLGLTFWGETKNLKQVERLLTVLRTVRFDSRSDSENDQR